MKFLVPNYSCLQNLWLRGYRPQIPVLSVLNWICWTPPEKNSWVRHCLKVAVFWDVQLNQTWVQRKQSSVRLHGVTFGYSSLSHSPPEILKLLIGHSKFYHWQSLSLFSLGECRNVNILYYYWYSALGPVWAETRVQSGDWYGSGTLHSGQVLRGSLPLLSPAF